MSKIQWLDQPEDHDYAAAQSYLELHYGWEGARRKVEDLRRVSVRSFKAKDIIRASGLPILPINNKHVAKDMEKKELSPVLLVAGKPLIIADGYHRVCAVWFLDEDAEISAKIVMGA